jgi:outer membrane protein assembly factor BamD (BamD/ComL family)
MCYRMIYAGKTYEQSISEIYNRNVGEYTATMTDRFAAEAYNQADVHLYDTGIAEFKPYKIADKLIARADSLYQAGKKSDAYYAYRDVMYAYAENDSLFEHVAYEMAQIQGENEEFMDAEGEYYAFYTMWPNSVNAEKAMFSRGFMLNENLGWNDKALKVLEEFLQKYPNSELKESAQWLVDNIKSNGKLAEDLMKKIEAEE